MGIWNEFRSVAAKLLNRKVADDTVSSKTTDHFRVSPAQNLEERVDACRRENIGKVLTNIGKFAVDSAVEETIKGVSGLPTNSLYIGVSGLPSNSLHIGVSGGMQVSRTAKEGLKDQPSSHSSDGSKKQGLLLVMEELLANIERRKGDNNRVNQEHLTSTQCDARLEPLKEFCDEPVKGSAPQETGRGRIFIRSRL